MQDTISVHLSIGISHIRKHISLYFIPFIFFLFSFLFFFFFLRNSNNPGYMRHWMGAFQFLSCWLDWLSLRFPSHRCLKYIMIDLSGFLSLIFTSSSRLTSKVPFANSLSKLSSTYLYPIYILLVFPITSTWNPSPRLQSDRRQFPVPRVLFNMWVSGVVNIKGTTS